ncbi:nucleoside deaminase [Micromonospora sp. CA-244673]|uniref:nucleoside deaminase n=1 Tax=Micromonospora sp. CA-244673 TaxID=3239958 RepID=UPI003D943073
MVVAESAKLAMITQSNGGPAMTTDQRDITHLRRCVALAAEALAAGDDPFGSVLVGPSGDVLAEARNRETSSADPTAHPELALAQWAAGHLPPAVRATATVYTSGEHCPMCAAAHAWVGLGRIVYAASSAQLATWRAEWGLPDGPVAVLPVTTVAPALTVAGPVAPLDEEMRLLHERAAKRRVAR